MRITRGREFRPGRAWASTEVLAFGDVTVKVHWTDQPYRWHVNTGDEVFAVLDGAVDMHYREGGEERVVRLEAGDVAAVGDGEEHVAHPVGEARILVVERRDSD